MRALREFVVRRHEPLATARPMGLRNVLAKPLDKLHYLVAEVLVFCDLLAGSEGGAFGDPAKQSAFVRPVACVKLIHGRVIAVGLLTSFRLRIVGIVA